VTRRLSRLWEQWGIALVLLALAALVAWRVTTVVA